MSYGLYAREPGESKGGWISSGELSELRAAATDIASSGRWPEGSMLYVVFNPSQGGGVYEGYTVRDGKLVKEYAKHPWRMSRGAYREAGWAEGPWVNKVPEDYRKAAAKVRVSRRQLQSLSDWGLEEVGEQESLSPIERINLREVARALTSRTPPEEVQVAEKRYQEALDSLREAMKKVKRNESSS